MTECMPAAMEFTVVRRRQVVANFDGGRLTSDTGVVLLQEVDRRISLINSTNACLPDPRDPRCSCL